MWTTVKLGALCEVVTKGTTPTSVGFKFESEGINFVKVESLTSNNTFINSKLAKVSTECHEALKRSQLKEGDILFSIAGALGRTAIVTKDILPANTNQALAIVRLKENANVDKRFLLYVLNSESTKEQSESNKGGVAQQNLSLSQLKNYEITLPPLAEQQRIVAKLDAVFSSISKAETLLVEKEKEVSNIFEAQVRGYFAENVLGAEFKKLSEVSEYFNGLTYSPKDVCDEGVIVLRSSNIQDGKIELNDLVRVKKNIKEKLIVKPSDILICSRNGSKRLIGKSALIGDSSEEMTFGTFMMIVRSELNDYLQWFFKSSLFKQQISQGEHTAINQITRYMLDEVVLPVPSVQEREKVNEKINLLDKEIRDFLAILARQRKELLKLKASILGQELKPSEAA